MEKVLPCQERKGLVSKLWGKDIISSGVLTVGRAVIAHLGVDQEKDSVSLDTHLSKRPFSQRKQQVSHT